MKYRKLGDTDLEVSEISLGSWLTYSGGVEQEHTEACTKHAFDEGINFFDTANVYGQGAAEEAWGEILTDFKREDFVLATKVFFPMDEGEDDGLSKAQIEKQLDASLKRLQTDYVDLYQCHRFDTETPIEETMEALTAAVESGKVALHRVQRVDAGADRGGDRARCRRDGRDAVLSAAVQHHLAGARGRGVRALLGAGISQIVWSPLGQGVLTGKYKPGEERPEGSRATSDEMGWAMERYMADEVLTAVQRLEPIADAAGLTMAADGARLGPAAQGTSPRRSSAPAARAGDRERLGLGDRALEGRSGGDRRGARGRRHHRADARGLRQGRRPAPLGREAGEGRH